MKSKITQSSFFSRSARASCFAVSSFFAACSLLGALASDSQSGADATPVKGKAPALLIPVTSHRIDVGDDPEARYSGTPQFDWAFFGECMRPIEKWDPAMPAHRHVLGINDRFNMIEMGRVDDPPVWYVKNALEDKPAIPTLVFVAVGKINCTAEDGEKARVCDPEKIKVLLKHYPNAIFGGGQIAEVDDIFNWQFNQYYARLPAGVGGAVFPAAYFDFIESNLKRSPVPYMSGQHNTPWGTHYVARERVMSLGTSQMGFSGIIPSIRTLRSAAREYPFPYGVQFSGQINLAISNENAVVESGAKPVYALKPAWKKINYEKSYALCRQVLYLSWLNGARFFLWESGDFIQSKTGKGDWKTGKNMLFPSPLGTFTARAAKLIEDFGSVGPVQTPIALISEFSNTWRPPVIDYGKRIGFTILGNSPYAPGDYQMHGIRDLFYPHYLQTERIYADTMGEDYAISATPYGESVDYLLSDVRQEALSRYGLVIWTGVPPMAPSMVREKLLGHIRENGGRVVLFGAAARSMFPEWFTNDQPEKIDSGAQVLYGGKTFTEKSDFTLEKLRDGPGSKIPSLNVLATVNGKPLIVECMGGLVLALSDHGINSTPTLASSAARWTPGQLVTEIPHTLLDHARRLLDGEARRQTLFTVGNEELHYVVTRPKDGEYVLGIFNDRLKSEPFRIKSNIGTIKALVEINPNDNQAELKSVLGGLAYAPPGLRDSPKLPLDYGLSDASHIEGRDFRLFRIQVEESGVRPTPPIHYPDRPVGRVLAVAGLENIRPYLQGISMFFSWFDGVKVDAGAFLSLEDSWLVEQGHWLDRRGVRVVVDGIGTNEETAADVIAKLSLLKKAPKDLIVASPSQNLKKAAELAGVRLLAPSAVNRLSQKSSAFSEKAALNILDLYYKSEEALSCDLRYLTLRQDVPALHGIQVSSGFASPLLAAEGLRGGVCDAGPDLFCLKEFSRCHRADLRKFQFLKIDSTYLLSKTSATLTGDAAALAKTNLKVVVDMRPDQMHFDRITFYPHIPNYETGMRLYSQIIDKMKAIGAANLILRIYDSGDMRGINKYIEQRDKTWSEFARVAAQKGINLHLVCDPRIKFSPAAAFDNPNVLVITGPKEKGKPSPYR